MRGRGKYDESEEYSSRSSLSTASVSCWQLWLIGRVFLDPPLSLESRDSDRTRKTCSGEWEIGDEVVKSISIHFHFPLWAVNWFLFFFWWTRTILSMPSLHFFISRTRAFSLPWRSCFRPTVVALAQDNFFFLLLFQKKKKKNRVSNMIDLPLGLLNGLGNEAKCTICLR